MTSIRKIMKLAFIRSVKLAFISKIRNKPIKKSNALYVQKINLYTFNVRFLVIFGKLITFHHIIIVIKPFYDIYQICTYTMTYFSATLTFGNYTFSV